MQQQLHQTLRLRSLRKFRNPTHRLRLLHYGTSSILQANATMGFLYRQTHQLHHHIHLLYGQRQQQLCLRRPSLLHRLLQLLCSHRQRIRWPPWPCRHYPHVQFHPEPIRCR
ncbi:hypothetical protein LINPERHAP1_LOCUS7695 [Linum perenne]